MSERLSAVESKPLPVSLKEAGRENSEFGSTERERQSGTGRSVGVQEGEMRRVRLWSIVIGSQPGMLLLLVLCLFPRVRVSMQGALMNSYAMVIAKVIPICICGCHMHARLMRCRPGGPRFCTPAARSPQPKAQT